MGVMYSGDDPEYFEQLQAFKTLSESFQEGEVIFKDS